MQTKTVLITGTSTGFGRDTAKRFSLAGWNVIATMRSPERETALQELPGVFVTRLDVQDRPSIDAAIAAGIEKFGGIDVLINNAGFGLFGLFESTAREKVMEQFEVNVFGLMDVTRAMLPHFRARKAGVIVNVTSGAGIFGLPMISLYTASKFAVEGFSESLSYELASQGITVKLLEPGGVLETDFGKRSGGEAALGTPIADYAPFFQGALAKFAQLRENRALATSAGVAKEIFDAATDGTARLRYVATEDIKPLVDARRGTSEEQYMALMRARFAP